MGPAGSLASQQGVRGAPIVDAGCVAGLELFKVSPFTGTGLAGADAAGNPTFINSNDYLWSSATNLDLAFMMWNEPHSGTNNEQDLQFGIMLRGDTTSNVQPNDVFGAPVSQVVLISGSLAWRVQMELPIGRIQNQTLTQGIALTRGNTTLNVIELFTGERGLSQFPVLTPLPFLVYFFYDNGRLWTAANPASANTGGGVLLELISANYAGFRIYDFTLAQRDGTGWQHTDARMPQSQGGSNTSDRTVPDPAQQGSTINNDSFWYIDDAVIIPAAERSISALASWDENRTATAGTAFTIANVLTEAFSVLPVGDPVSVAVSPASDDIDGASYTFDRSTNAFSFIGAAGSYSLVFTASMDNLAGRRAEARLNLTVS